MNNQIEIGTIFDTGKIAFVDLLRTLEGRLLMQANSGGGKSWLVRKFIEAVKKIRPDIQIIIIDLEGEYATLREKFDFLLVGKDGDIEINLESAEILATKLLELNTSAIIDLYELKPHERIRFVKLFFDSMINSPKELWHYVLVVLDEGHVFAPEKGYGEAESLDSVKDMASRGRKRGFALVIATQRIAKLHKDVVAELNTKLIGRCSLDTDLKRAAFELGFTNKTDILSLRQLKAGEFFAFGSAISDMITKIKVGNVETSHPKVGARINKQTTATPQTIKQILSKLADLPAKARRELKTKDDMLKTIHTQTRQIHDLETRLRHNTPNQEQLENFARQHTATLRNEYRKETERLSAELRAKTTLLNQIAALAGKVQPINSHFQKPESTPKPITSTATITKKSLDLIEKVESDLEEKTIPQGALVILKAIAMFYPEYTSRAQVSTITKYSMKSSTFDEYLRLLKRQELILADDNGFKVTEHGLNVAGNVESLPTDPNSILQMWIQKLPTGAGKILKVVFENSKIDKIELAEKSGFSATSSTYGEYLRLLKRNKLVEISQNEVSISQTFFPTLGVLQH